MSSGPSTLGIMITSTRSPISVTAVVRSSSAHGESRALTRVHSCVSPYDHAAPISTSPDRAASLSLAGMPSSRLARSTSTVGAIAGTLATILGFDGGRKWIIRDGRTGISRTGSGAPTASGRKKSLGGRIGAPAYGGPSGARQSGQAEVSAVGDDEAVGDEAGHDRRRERFDRCSTVGEGMQDATAGLASAALVRRLRRTNAGGAESGVRNRMIAPAPGARVGERALGATRRGAAHGGAEVHHHLIPRPAATARHHLVGHRLDSLSRQPLTGEAGEQAGDVRFDN